MDPLGEFGSVSNIAYEEKLGLQRRQYFSSSKIRKQCVATNTNFIGALSPVRPDRQIIK